MKFIKKFFNRILDDFFNRLTEAIYLGNSVAQDDLPVTHLPVVRHEVIDEIYGENSDQYEFIPMGCVLKNGTKLVFFGLVIGDNMFITKENQMYIFNPYSLNMANKIGMMKTTNDPEEDDEFSLDGEDRERTEPDLQVMVPIYSLTPWTMNDPDFIVLNTEDILTFFHPDVELTENYFKNIYQIQGVDVKQFNEALKMKAEEFDPDHEPIPFHRLTEYMNDLENDEWKDYGNN